jgi:hypothetical protein
MIRGRIIWGIVRAAPVLISHGRPRLTPSCAGPTPCDRGNHRAGSERSVLRCSCYNQGQVFTHDLRKRLRVACPTIYGPGVPLYGRINTPPARATRSEGTNTPSIFVFSGAKKGSRSGDSPGRVPPGPHTPLPHLVGRIVLIQSVWAMRLDPARLYGVAPPLGGGGNLHQRIIHATASYKPPRRAGVPECPATANPGPFRALSPGPKP